MKSREKPRTSRAFAARWSITPARTIGPTGCRRYSKDVTTPKFPPPPRSPQKRSACCSALARRRSPSAVTTAADRTLAAPRAEVGVLLDPGPKEVAVGGDHIGRQDVVGGQSVPAHQPAEAPAERET